MFELLFKYPASIFHKGQFVFLTPWPLWALAIAILAAAGLLFWGDNFSCFQNSVTNFLGCFHSWIKYISNTKKYTLIRVNAFLYGFKDCVFIFFPCIFQVKIPRSQFKQ